VVTLVADQGAVCWGLAFRPQGDLWSAVIADLDHRERNGYVRTDIELEFETGERVAAITYIAGAENPSFVGPAPLAAILAQVATAHGPSGSNREYVLRLAENLTGLGVHDAEVHDLAHALEAFR
jgi:cation transport regulator ChaC